MKSRLHLTCLIIALLALPIISAASDWISFAPPQKDDSGWFYDKSSISYPRNKEFLGINVYFRDRNFPLVWVRSPSVTANQIYLVEINCRERTARMTDNNGTNIYSLNSIDYLYDRPIPPNTVLDMLHKAVCRAVDIEKLPPI